MRPPRRQPIASAFCDLSSAKSFLIKRRTRGQVWLKIVWQTGATSEHHVQRRVHSYRNYIDIDRLRRRIVELNAEHKMDGEIAAILNQEGFVAARGCAFKSENVWALRTRWGIPTTKINGATRIRCAGLTVLFDLGRGSRAWSNVANGVRLSGPRGFCQATS